MMREAVSKTAVAGDQPNQPQQPESGAQSQPKAQAKSPKPAGSRESIQEMKARMKREMEAAEGNPPVVKSSEPDPYALAEVYLQYARGKTGLGYDLRVGEEHVCEWDKEHPENTSRFVHTYNRIVQLGLDKRCVVFKNQPFIFDILDRIRQVHTSEHVQKLFQMCQPNYSESDRENFCAQYDAIYLSENSAGAAMHSLNTLLALCQAIASNKIMNGMAIIRPPGHHAGMDEFNGYCFFNNVAIAADYFIDKGFKRVLIIDVDVHHGQGVQDHFYKRDDVLYFSIHRYEWGSFWPELLRSNYHAVGEQDGRGFNINVPLNATCLKDDDYLAIVLYLLLPVAYEFNPDIIFLAAGYDAAIGCPEGRMLVTPAFYSHLVTLLGGLANGRIIVALEGGYFRPSLAEGAAMTLKALLHDPCPQLDPIRCVEPTVLDTINNVRAVHSKYWKCFKNTTKFAENSGNGNHVVLFYYQPGIPKMVFPTRASYPLLTWDDQERYTSAVQGMKLEYHRYKPTAVGYIYSEKQLKHAAVPGTIKVDQKECPERLLAIMERFKRFDYDGRVLRVDINEKHNLRRYIHHDPRYLATIGPKFDHRSDLYCNEHTMEACCVGLKGLLTLADEILLNRTLLKGIGIIRPPGHHAERDHAKGFCFLNNVAILANYLIDNHFVNRIAIVDFDVHHGNGTQNAFYDNPKVLYVSVHRYELGKFFPSSSTADFSYSGFGPGDGYNMNIPFSGGNKMTDSEYIAVFLNLILPTLYSYGPDFVIVSAGFDAGLNDLGGYKLSAGVFGHFLQLLKPLAGGKMIMALEGGYNLPTLKYSFNMSVKAILGDPLPRLRNLFQSFIKDASTTIFDVAGHFTKYYPIFNCLKTISPQAMIHKKVTNANSEAYVENSIKVINPQDLATYNFEAFYLGVDC